jgi:DNA end-binding protein Ku
LETERIALGSLDSEWLSLVSEFQMAVRAQWKGFLCFGGVSCPVALYTAVSTSERIAFSTINRSTGNRVKREYVDLETGKPVSKEDQIKGYEIDDGRFITLTPEEVASAVPAGEKTLKVEAFIDCSSIDDVYFDKPYFLAPSDRTALDAYMAIRDGLKSAKAAAIAKAVLFRRMRTVLIRAHGRGLIATTLNYDYEVRSAKTAFEAVPDLTIQGEMLDLARHIITTKSGAFDPREFHDRYEAALAELVRAKVEGKALPKHKALIASRPSDLLEALRQSAGVAAPSKKSRTAANANAGPRRAKRAGKATSAAETTRRKAS